MTPAPADQGAPEGACRSRACRSPAWRAAGKAREAGFTLLEVLAALFIVAMLSAAGLAVLNNALDAQDFINARETRLRELQVSRALMRDDVAQMITRTVRDPFGEPNPFVFRGGLADGDAPLLAFTRSGWTNPGGFERRGPLQHVAYHLRGGDLVRRTRLRTDLTPDTPVIERVVLTGVEDIRLSFAGPEWEAGRPVWLDFWEITTETAGFQPPPRLIAIELTVRDVGPVRHVFAAPDITPPALQEAS